MRELRLLFSLSLLAFASMTPGIGAEAVGDDAPPRTASAEYYLAFWNVENLFDTEDDPAVAQDEEFTPLGPKKWNQERLQRKLGNLARLIRSMNDGKGPDLLGLAEVENRRVLELLVEQLRPLRRRYEIVHQDSPSGRGIDCAILYDAGVWDLNQARFHAVRRIDPPTRDIVEVELRSAQAESLYVFVNHWPSRTHPDSDRIQAATTLRERLDKLFATSPGADAIVMGDLNDFPDSPSVKGTLRGVADPKLAVAGRLYNACWPWFKNGEKGTYVYKDKWEVIDQVLLSPGLLDTQGWQWKPDSTEPVLVVTDQLFDPAGDPRPRPNRSFSGDRFHPSGYSDHLPIKSILFRRSAAASSP